MIEVFDCPQNSPEWFAARLGIPTASMFATVMAKGRDGGESLTRKTYMLKLAGEIVTGDPMDNYTNEHMERGHVMESEARNLYEFLSDEPLQRVGFIRNGKKGASPDSLIGSDGGVEFKTQLPHRLIETLLVDRFPSEFLAQCQGGIWVAEREWWDLGVFWPRLPFFAKRVYRDETYIKKLSAAVDKFNDELAEVVEKVRKYGVAA